MRESLSFPMCSSPACMREMVCFPKSLTPLREALKHGFNLNLNSDELDNFVEECLDELEWEEKAATAIKWARLYGGSIIVMLIDDGQRAGGAC